MLDIYNFYVFDRRGSCMFYHEWKREHNPDPEGDPKLVFGLLFSLKQLSQKMAPISQEKQDQEVFEGVAAGNVNSFSTSAYTLHQFETSSGLRFVLLTSKCQEQLLKDIQVALRHVYSDLFVNIIMKNPLYSPGASINNPNFTKQLDRYMIGMAKRFA